MSSHVARDVFAGPMRKRVELDVWRCGLEELRILAENVLATFAPVRPDKEWSEGTLERRTTSIGVLFPELSVRITRTKLGTLAIAETHEAAEALLESWPARKGLDPERLRGTLILGTPDDVAGQVAAFVAAGLEGLVVNMPNPHDLDAVALAGEALGRALG